MEQKAEDNLILYYKYLGLWGNLDFETQVEMRPLSYTEFIKSDKRIQLIDFIKSMIYNKKNRLLR